MNQDLSITEKSYEMKFDIGTIKHLGLQMYSTLPPVIGELVANAWDANAPRVDITIPEGPIDPERSEIIIDGRWNWYVRQGCARKIPYYRS